ncbi:MAG: hypothetical protein CMB02_01720 [Euryarchaeota archaeon]|nr:hypothetical protein [Euryarchaeota archaeon]
MMRAQSKSEPWELHWKEVAVFDRNASSLGIDEFELMLSASESLAKEAAAMSKGGPVLFLCGPGNNGGDGFLASCSQTLSDSEVVVVASHEKSKTSTSARARESASSRSTIHLWPEVPNRDWSLIVDCLLGAGFSGPGTEPRGKIGEITSWVASCSSPVLSCDIPTGLGSQGAIVADRTVTFHSRKMWMSESGCGEVVVSKLPWPDSVVDCGIGDAARYPVFSKDARKGDRGRLLVIGGGPYHGAPILSGLAAARSGCDLVHVAMPSSASGRTKWPNSLIPEILTDEDYLTSESTGDIAEFLDSPRRPQAMLIGPGIGREESTVEIVKDIISMASSKEIPVVVDADAISSLPVGKWPEGLQGVATPHHGEAERWLSGTTPRKALQGSNGETAAIVVTGQRDEITGPDGRFCYATGGHPRMAVGGTGDLLAGLIGGLLAQGMAAWPASRLGCAVLREAGNRATRKTGPGLLAEDVPVHIAHTLSDWTRSA